VIDKIAIARWAVVGGIIAAVGVAGAATKLKRPTTGDACLCTPDAQAPNDLTAALEPSASSSSSASHGFGAPAGSTSTPGSLAAALSASSAAEHGAGAAAYGGGAGGAGFGAGGRFIGARSGSGGSHSAALGGLWRLMSLSHRAPSHPASSVHAAVSHPARQPKPQHPRNGNSSGGSSSSHAPSPSLPPGVSLVSDLFAEQTASIPDLLGGGNAPVISTPGGHTGNLGGGLGRGSGSLSATPEPGPLFLVGAGLIAIASLLRRRLIA